MTTALLMWSRELGEWIRHPGQLSLFRTPEMPYDLPEIWVTGSRRPSQRSMDGTEIPHLRHRGLQLP